MELNIKNHVDGKMRNPVIKYPKGLHSNLQHYELVGYCDLPCIVCSVMKVHDDKGMPIMKSETDIASDCWCGGKLENGKCARREAHSSDQSELGLAADAIEETRPFQRLLKQHGSQRRVMEAYWTGKLTPAEESAIEDKVSLEQRVMYKPTTFSTAAKIQRMNSVLQAFGYRLTQEESETIEAIL